MCQALYSGFQKYAVVVSLSLEVYHMARCKSFHGCFLLLFFNFCLFCDCFKKLITPIVFLKMVFFAYLL